MTKFRYLPMTDQDRKEMLKTIGVGSVEELFAEIPEEVRFQGELNLPEAMSEPVLVRHMARMAGKMLRWTNMFLFWEPACMNTIFPVW